MTRASLFIAAALFGWAIAAGPTPATADAEKETAARAAAETLVADTYGAMSTGGGGDAERLESVRAALDGAFAFDVWERFLLGDAAASFDESQLETFRAALPRYLARLYSNNFGKGLSKRPSVGEARTVRKDVVVSASIPRDKGGPLPVEYRFRELAGRGPQVIDVMVGGASFLLLKRDEFGAVLKKDGPDGLLTYMQRFVSTPGS